MTMCWLLPWRLWHRNPHYHSLGMSKHNSELQKSACLALPLPLLIWQMDRILGGGGGGGAAIFGSEGQRWQLFVCGGLLRALALSTYCVLLTEPWCHHRPLALTACHHVTLELMVKQCKVRTVNKDGMLRNKQGFSNVSLKISSLLCI